MFKNEFGTYGEKIAQKYLIKNEFEIIQMNFKCVIGEIDIIAVDKKYLVFVEVKCRTSDKFGRPCEAVTYAKQKKIRRIAELYLKKIGALNALVRFDVIEILGKEINHIKNAF
ncbi:MAG: YraN family protein [Clostridia bacterium]